MADEHRASTDRGSKEARKKPGLRAKLAAALVATFLCGILMEGAVRLLGRRDDDGQFWFIVPVRPYALPARETARGLDEYRRRERPYQVFHPLLGWTLNWNAVGHDGLYRSNNIGIRADQDTLVKADGKRIALFGDSFVHGDDVPLEETWAHALGDRVGAEVLNFGVGGYGNDQAYLRWKLEGRQYEPDVVVIGFQPENCRRNLNLVRKILNRESGIPFSKPRFVLHGSSLLLVNSPTVPPAEIPGVLADFEQWPNHQHEYYYHRADYQDSWLYASRAVAALLTLGGDAVRRQRFEAAFFDDGTVGPMLCEAILTRFAREASREARVVILHIPRKPDLAMLLDGKPLLHQQLLERLRAEFVVVDPAPRLVEAARGRDLDELFALGRHHYAGATNRIVAEVAAEKLREVLATTTERD